MFFSVVSWLTVSVDACGHCDVLVSVSTDLFSDAICVVWLSITRLELGALLLGRRLQIRDALLVRGDLRDERRILLRQLRDARARVPARRVWTESRRATRCAMRATTALALFVHLRHLGVRLELRRRLGRERLGLGELGVDLVDELRRRHHFFEQLLADVGERIDAERIGRRQRGELLLGAVVQAANVAADRTTSGIEWKSLTGSPWVKEHCVKRVERALSMFAAD